MEFVGNPLRRENRVFPISGVAWFSGRPREFVGELFEFVVEPLEFVGTSFGFVG